MAIKMGAPDGYTRLKYIYQYTGTAYIDTGVKLDLNTDGFEICAKPSTPSQNGFILGDWTTSDNYFWLYHYQGGGVIRMYLTDSSYSQVNYNLDLASSDTNIHTYIFKNKQMFVDGGSAINPSSGSSTVFSIPTGNCYLFRANGTNGANYPYKGSIYYCRLYKKGILVRDFIPVKQNSSGAYGFYDLVSKTFFGNAGTGSFSYDADSGVKDVIYNGNVVDYIIKDGIPIWAHSISYTRGSLPSHCNTLTCNVTSTKEPTQTIPRSFSSSTTIYNGDEMYWTASLDEGYICSFNYSQSNQYIARAAITNAVTTSGLTVQKQPYLRFSSDKAFWLVTGNSAKNWDGTIEYATVIVNDVPAGWTVWNGTSQINAILDFGKYSIILRGTNNTYLTGSSDTGKRFVFNANDTTTRIDAYGDLATLVDYTSFVNNGYVSKANYCYTCLFYNNNLLRKSPLLDDTQMVNYCYYMIFYGCTSLTIPPPRLPATTAKTYCYGYMFYGCTALSTPPTIALTSLTNYCCHSMFRNCTKLSSCPTLNATTMASYCYGYMFYGCTSLVYPPALNSTSLAASCYRRMFYGCTSLVETMNLPATRLANYCYQYMFYGCTALRKLKTKFPATTLATSCYENMFYNCTKIKVDQVKHGNYQLTFRIPTSGTGTVAANALNNMISIYNSDSLVGSTPSINTTYYLYMLDLEEPDVYLEGETSTEVSLEVTNTNPVTVNYSWEATIGDGDTGDEYESSDSGTLAPGASFHIYLTAHEVSYWYGVVYFSASGFTSSEKDF